MKQKSKKVVILYEVEQIEKTLSYVNKNGISLDDCTIIPLEFEVDRALLKSGILYEPFTKYVPIEEEFSDVLDSARSSAKRFHEHPVMQFYKYQEINLGEVFEPMIDMYLEHLGRYTSIFNSITDVVEAEEIIIPHTYRPLSPDGAVLTPFESTSAVSAVQSVGRRKGIKVSVIGTPMHFSRSKGKTKELIESLMLSLYNACIRLFIRRRSLKLYASEYWSHIESFIEKMDDVELVFMERSEIKSIRWRQLLRHRIRFLHPSDAIDSVTNKKISQTVKDFSKRWHAVKAEVREVFNISPGVDMWPEIENALTYLIDTQTSRAITDIEGLRHIMQKERPDKVLLRASIGGTAHHFFVATQVAHQLGIPSIELQHAGAIVDPRSVHSRLTASYIAGYGKQIQDEYSKNGYARERICSIGSPRFDHYVHERDNLTQDRAKCLTGIFLNPSRQTIFVAVPFPGPYPLLLNSYQVANFFDTLRLVQIEMPELQFIFKFRPGSFSIFYKDYIEELFVDGGVFATDTNDFLPFITASNIAVAGRSTLMYEIMLGGRPMILFPWQRWDIRTLEMYVETLSVAKDGKELSALLQKLLNKEESETAIKKQNAFLAENYSFDGKAPERMVSLLREKLLPLP